MSARGAYFGRPRGFHLDFAPAKRLKSLFRRAGDQNSIRLPYAGGGPYAGRAVPSGTRYWPSGRENFAKEKPSPRVPSGTRTKEKTPRTKPTKPAEKPTNPQKTPRKTFSPTKTANNTTIRFIFTQIRPFRYAICSRKRCQKIRNHACHPLCPLARGTKYVENAHHEKSREPTTEPR